MSFFDAAAPSPPPRAPEHRPPPWVGPPDNVRPVTVALDVTVARTDDVAAWVGAAHVYDAGAVLDVAIARRQPPEAAPGRPGRPILFGQHDSEDPRFGVGFADGRRAVVGPVMGPSEGAPVLMFRGGGGSEWRWTGQLWLWPLPPAGELTFAFAWPHVGVPETTATTDATPLVAAASNATELWPDDRPPGPSSTTAVWHPGA